MAPLRYHLDVPTLQTPRFNPIAKKEAKKNGPGERYLLPASLLPDGEVKKGEMRRKKKATPSHCHKIDDLLNG